MAFLYGTVITSVIAIIIAVPVSVAIALLLTEVVPRRWAQPIVYVIDLLAVVPSVVWGLWGIIVLVPWLQTNIYMPIASGVNGIPVLDSLFGAPTSGASFFTAGIILAVMITPIITSLSREVIATVPTTDKEGAYALGATRWEMIRGAVWPHSQGGVVGAILVGPRPGDGRDDRGGAGDRLVRRRSPRTCSPRGTRSRRLSRTSSPRPRGEFRAALIGLGLMLFVITIIVNLGARGFVERSARRMRGA